MPVKTTKKITVKKSSVSKSNKKVVDSESTIKNEKKVDSVKKVVVKRRKLDLTPTRASAVAIASQANRAQKQALIEKFSNKSDVVSKSKKTSKIPVRVRNFFGLSLLLFCVSFYQAIIRPQLEEELTEANVDSSLYLVDWNTKSVSLWWNTEFIDNSKLWQKDSVEIENPKTANEAIEVFFKRLSNYQFDEAFDLFSPKLQRMWEIRDHFTSFRMNPFISWIEWELKPTNVKYISSSTYWKDRYGFDLSYTLGNTGETYYETREVVVDTSWDNLEISSIVCKTSKCSYHPIFWPENFGLMR